MGNQARSEFVTLLYSIREKQNPLREELKLRMKWESGSCWMLSQPQQPITKACSGKQ